MNLSIVIAVNEYAGIISNLPACSSDSAAITSYLKIIKKFDSQLNISDNLNSASVKEKLVQFIESHQGQQIDEIFFYYTGHGEFTGKEFYYLLSDFKSEKRRQTSLENTELDELLRSLNPKLTIKVIDACNAGVPYIKNIDSLGPYLKGTGGKFNKCYFLFSSQVDQSSYQDQNLSIFTRSFLEAIVNHSANSIRYKDIMDYLADFFASNTKQTPFFIIQSELTEICCKVTDKLRSSLKPFLIASSRSQHPQKPAAEQLSLAEFVKKDAERYCSKEEASDLLGQLVELFRKHTQSKDVNELYDIEIVTSEEYADYIDLESLGRSAKKYQQDYFIEPVQKKKNYYEEVDDNPSYLTKLRLIDQPSANIYDSTKLIYPELSSKFIVNHSSLPSLFSKTKKVERTRSVIVGVRSTTEMPYQQITIKAKPKYRNLETAISLVLPFLSRTSALMFYAVAKYCKTGWGEEQFQAEFDWKVSEVGLKNNVEKQQLIERIYTEMWKITLLPLKKRLKLVPEVEEEQSEEQINDYPAKSRGRFKAIT